MSPSQFKSTWTSIAVLVFLTISSVQAHPIRESSTDAAAQPESNIQPRDPVRTVHPKKANITNILIVRQRLIPDAEHYLGDAFKILGVADPTPSTKPTPTSDPFVPMNVEIEHDKPVNIKATPVVSSTTTVSTHPAEYTMVIRHGGNKPIENIQIGTSWNGKKKLTAEDLPVVFDAVMKVLSSRFRDMIDSADEVDLDKDNGLLGYLR